MAKPIRVRILGDASDLSRAFNKADGAAKGFSAKFGGTAKAIAGSMAAAFAAKQVVDFGGQMVDLGNKVENWRAKADTVFEGSANAMRRWSDENAAAMGLTGDELLGLSAGMGDLLKPMGFTGEHAAHLSAKTTELAGALSAWSGGQRDAADVSSILSKAMLGEREQLKELGISISEADVQARLAANGQDELTGSALQQAKALATQDLIFEKSADAQKAWGDGTFDNIKKQNELKAKIAEVKETLAEKFLPIFNRVVTYIVDNVVPAVEELAAKFQVWWAEVGPKVQAFIEGIVATVQQHWPVIQATIENVLTIISGIVATVLEQVRALWAEHGEQIMTTVQGFVDAIVVVVEYLVALWEDHGDVIIETISAMWGTVSGIIGGALDVIQGIVETFIAIFRGDWGAAWNGIKRIFSGVWHALAGIVRMAFEAVKGALRIAIDSVAGILKGIGTALGRTAREVWDKAWDIGKNIINGIKDGVTGAVGFAADIGKSVGNAIVGFINRNVIDKFNRGLEFRIEVFGRGVDINPPDVPHLPRFAAGGRSMGGFAVVGERGPEVVSLPRGAEVTPNYRMGGGGDIIVNATTNADPTEIGREIAWQLRTAGV